MIEPNITEQLLGVGIMLLGVFVLMLFTMKHESKEVETTEEVTTDFYEIARMNLKKSDKQFTYDVEPPIGLN
jgi:gp18